MADTTISVRVDEDIKRKFEDFCADVGINMSIAVNMFIRASLKDMKIPFPIESPRPPYGFALLSEMRSGAKAPERLNADIMNTAQIREKLNEGLSDAENKRVRPAREAFAQFRKGCSDEILRRYNF